MFLYIVTQAQSTPVKDGWMERRNLTASSIDRWSQYVTNTKSDGELARLLVRTSIYQDDYHTYEWVIEEIKEQKKKKQHRGIEMHTILMNQPCINLKVRMRDWNNIMSKLSVRIEDWSVCMDLLVLGFIWDYSINSIVKQLKNMVRS